MAYGGWGRSVADSGRRDAAGSANADTNSGSARVPAQQPAGPAVWSALGRVAGTAWTGLKLAHRYVLAPATVWVLKNIKAYVEEQLAIQRAMGRSCPVPTYGEADVRQATDDMGFTRRALGTPYGMVVYLTQLRGAQVAVRQVSLHRLADVDAFWSEAAAGRALLSAGRHAHVVPYMGCCPALACHVYEHRAGACSLREALLPTSACGGSGALGSWEVRVALCRQLVSAAVYLLRSGVCARELSTAHIILSLGDCGGGEEPVRACGSSLSSGGPADRGPRCWLAPGCEFRREEAPAQQPQPAAAAGHPHPQPGAWRNTGGAAAHSGGSNIHGQPPTASAGAGRAEAVASGEQFLLMGRALGVVLLQVVAGADSPVPPAATVLRALADMAPTCLLSTAVAPPLTDDQAWPLLAAIYSLVNWGAGGRKPGPGETAPERGAGVGRGARVDSASGSAAGISGGAAAAASAGPTSEYGRSLLRHLVEEVAPVLEDVQFQIRWTASPPTTTAPPAATTSCGPAGPAPPAAPSPPDDAFAGASAPPLPASLQPPGALLARPAAVPAAPADTPQRPAEQAPPPPPPAAWSPRPTFPATAGTGRPGAPPEELLCPITTDLMEDPVVAADGHSYERAAISRWLAARPSRATSPLTGAVLPHTSLTPNYALRKIIADWREKHGA